MDETRGGFEAHMKSLKDLIDDKKKADADSTSSGLRRASKYISREFQDYGYRLAVELGDLEHKTIYMRLAKTVDRGLLEQCRRFVIDSNADKKGALFMWKMKELKEQKMQNSVKSEIEKEDAF